MIEISRSITKKLHRALLPYEDDICKLEDLVFFLNPKRSILFFIIINLQFLIIYFTHFSIYSIIFISLGLYFSSSFTNLRNLYSIFLEKKISDIGPDKNFRRFNIAQISAIAGTCVYAIFFILERAFNGVIKRNFSVIFGTLFILFLLLSLFFSISDLFFCCIALNITLLLPLLLQKKTFRVINLYQERIFYKLLTKKKSKIEESEEFISHQNCENGSLVKNSYENIIKDFKPDKKQRCSENNDLYNDENINDDIKKQDSIQDNKFVINEENNENQESNNKDQVNCTIDEEIIEKDELDSKEASSQINEENEAIE